MPTEPTNKDVESWVPTLDSGRHSQSLERGLMLLTCYTPRESTLGIKEMADKLSMSGSTIHRYALTLVALGYLEQLPNRKYRLGVRVTDLGMSALNSTGLREHAHPYLEELSGRIPYALTLGVLSGPDVSYTDYVLTNPYGRREQYPELQLGSRAPAPRSALGRLLMANLPTEELAELLDAMELSDRVALQKQLEGIHSVGYATTEQELVPGFLAMAVPVQNESRKVVAALGLTAPDTAISLDRVVRELGPDLTSAANRISARLGYRHSGESPVLQAA